ncbi:hypothetical protein FOZ61_010813 [Perkinsus olseni]|uniref:beta-N-acetylhexosaminidase n=1 Tax=Perkinsus olseni TaxID=32597 RepID=A0A7J6KVW8_PEROL|nr:hypothetical protein FOZ61_010813 [Perkinsus olseni]
MRQLPRRYVCSPCKPDGGFEPWTFRAESSDLIGISELPPSEFFPEELCLPAIDMNFRCPSVAGYGNAAATPPQPPLMIWPVPKSITVNGVGKTSKTGDDYGSCFAFKLQANGGPVVQEDLDFVLNNFVHGMQISTPSHPVAVSVEYDVGLLDEAYEFTCTPQLCHLKFSSRSGFFYGMLTAFQISHNHADGLTSIINTGFNITDYPSFPHRGMLIDTGRRYLPVDLIKKNLHTMAWVKMNVLHWHISDDISFSVQLENYSRLQFNNPTPVSYTADEVKEVVEYANSLNIKVIPEMDVPAHTTSWIRGARLIFAGKLLLKADCFGRYPFLTGEADYWMDPISERVVHLGGDEVGDAWNTPALEQWARDHGKFHNRTDLVDYWISHTIAEVKRRTGARVILWNDFLDDHTTQADTIDTWQIWRYDTSQTLDMAASGNFGGLIYSSAFFLDLLGDDWATFYDVPLKRDGAGVIKGGEACMWGSHWGY